MLSPQVRGSTKSDLIFSFCISPLYSSCHLNICVRLSGLVFQWKSFHIERRGYLHKCFDSLSCYFKLKSIHIKPMGNLHMCFNCIYFCFSGIRRGYKSYRGLTILIVLFWLYTPLFQSLFVLSLHLGCLYMLTSCVFQ